MTSFRTFPPCTALNLSSLETRKSFQDILCSISSCHVHCTPFIIRNYLSVHGKEKKQRLLYKTTIIILSFFALRFSSPIFFLLERISQKSFKR